MGSKVMVCLLYVWNCFVRSVKVKRLVVLISISCVCVCLYVLNEGMSYNATSLATRQFREDRSATIYTTSASMNELDLLSRSKIQQELVHDYCLKHPTLGSKFNLPRTGEQRDLLYRHLLYDDLREILFCFVEKIGCTDMKRFMFIAAGVLPEKSATHEWVDLKYLEKGIRRASLLNKNLTEFKRLQKLRRYFKFTILRNPLERLVSGYRNKIQPPLLGLSEKFPNLVKREILRKQREDDYLKWLKAEGTYNISISFSEFVDYFIATDKQIINPHFKPFIHTCHPCNVDYDFYGNFQNYGAEVKLVADMFGLDFNWYRNKSLHSNLQSTRNLLKKYYNQLSKDQKRLLLGSLQDELDFYYTLYPDEKLIHHTFFIPDT